MITSMQSCAVHLGLSKETRAADGVLGTCLQGQSGTPLLKDPWSETWNQTT